MRYFRCIEWLGRTHLVGEVCSEEELKADHSWFSNTDTDWPIAGKWEEVLVTPRRPSPARRATFRRNAKPKPKQLTKKVALFDIHGSLPDPIVARFGEPIIDHPKMERLSDWVDVTFTERTDK